MVGGHPADLCILLLEVAGNEAAMREYRHFEARKEQRPMKKRRASARRYSSPSSDLVDKSNRLRKLWRTVRH